MVLLQHSIYITHWNSARCPSWYLWVQALIFILQSIYAHKLSRFWALGSKARALFTGLSSPWHFKVPRGKRRICYWYMTSPPCPLSVGSTVYIAVLARLIGLLAPITQGCREISQENFPSRPLQMNTKLSLQTPHTQSNLINFILLYNIKSRAHFRKVIGNARNVYS